MIIRGILERFNENCQVIATTHSPFVAQSVGIDKIQIFVPNENKPSSVEEDLLSYPGIAEGIFGIESEYSIELEQKIDSFKDIVSKIRNKMDFDKQQFINLSEDLANEGESINVAVSFELRKLRKEGLID